MWTSANQASVTSSRFTSIFFPPFVHCFLVVIYFSIKTFCKSTCCIPSSIHGEPALAIWFFLLFLSRYRPNKLPWLPRAENPGTGSEASRWHDSTFHVGCPGRWSGWYVQGRRRCYSVWSGDEEMETRVCWCEFCECSVLPRVSVSLVDLHRSHRDYDTQGWTELTLLYY